MAPNRKNIADSVATLSVQDFINLKFLPLTHPDEQKAQVETPKLQQQQRSEESSPVVSAREALDAAQSYWDWPATTSSKQESQLNLVNTIVEEEAVREILSVQHMEEALKSASAASDMVVVKSASEEEEEGYWIMPNETAAAAVDMDEHDSYWNWSTPTKEEVRSQVVDAIKEEEECRVMLSVDRIEQSLVQQSAKECLEKRDNAEHDSYWEWTGATESARNVSEAQHTDSSYWDWLSAGSVEEKNQMLEEMVREEAIRQGLSVDHVEAQLVREAGATTAGSASANVAVVSAGCNASYWAW